MRPGRPAPAARSRCAMPAWKGCNDLGPRFVQRRQAGQSLNAGGIQNFGTDAATENHEFLVIFREVRNDFRGRHRIDGEGNRRRSAEQLAQSLVLRTRKGETREPILGHFEAGTRRPHTLAEVGNFRHRQPGVMGDDDTGAPFERLVQRGNQRLFLRSVHRSSPVLWPVQSGPSGPHRRTVGHEVSGNSGNRRSCPVLQFKPFPEALRLPSNGSLTVYAGGRSL